MRILLTGASSFTGFWFTRELSQAHDIVAPLRAQTYPADSIRARRVASLPATVIADCPFGSQSFLDLCAAGPWDLLCHHAAEVGDYRSPHFDVLGALAANTRQLPKVLDILQHQGLKGVILTGSVFEPNEGAGTDPRRAFSPYGLSKGLTADLVAFWCDRLGVKLAKFVIPNPFGPFEEPRFCHYLVASWRRNDTPEVRAPFYVRDNIHVDLLAACYRLLCERMADGTAPPKLAPSQYAETQGAFAQRFAAAFAARLGRDFPIALAPRQSFEEPPVRINTDPAIALCPAWDEAAAWNQMVASAFAS